MDLLIENPKSDITIIRPIVSGNRNISNIVARAKIFILENPDRTTILDLTCINFLDCIKIGTIIGTYHFLEFSGRKIYILVNNIEIKKALESLSFNNIEISCNSSLVLEGIA